ncbi:MAG: Ig-like domain-containing protein [Chitinophagales bacterium]
MEVKGKWKSGFKIILAIAITFCLMAVLPVAVQAAIDDGTPSTDTVNIDMVRINKSLLYLTPGQSETLTVISFGTEVSWSSSNTSVAIVDETGKVTGIALGKATITVMAVDGSFDEICDVIVNTGAVTKVSLNKTVLTLVPGQNYTLKATIKPYNAINKNVSWSSSDANVATVDETGKVTTAAVGTATITATTEDGGYKATCDITVVESIKVTSVELVTSLETTAGAIRQMYAYIKPTDATNQNVTWSSSDLSIVTIDQTGKLIGVKAGTANITITTEDGGFTDTCIVTVKDPAVLANFTITINLSGSAPDGNYTWSSSNDAVAIIKTTDSRSATVQGVSAGTVVITAVLDGGGYAATYQLTVTTIPVTSVSVYKRGVTLKVGEQVQIKAFVLPTDASNKRVIWSSEDTNIATVSDGLIIAVGEGITNVIATTEDGGLQAICKVVVDNDAVPVGGVYLDMYKNDFDMIAGGPACKLSASVLPENATNKNIVWSGSNSVATVENGVVTPLSWGYTLAGATTEDGTIVKYCSIDVCPSYWPHFTSFQIGGQECLALPGVGVRKDTSVVHICATDGSSIDSTEDLARLKGAVLEVPNFTNFVGVSQNASISNGNNKLELYRYVNGQLCLIPTTDFSTVKLQEDDVVLGQIMGGNAGFVYKVKLLSPEKLSSFTIGGAECKSLSGIKVLANQDEWDLARSGVGAVLEVADLISVKGAAAAAHGPGGTIEFKLYRDGSLVDVSDWSSCVFQNNDVVMAQWKDDPANQFYKVTLVENAALQGHVTGVSLNKTSLSLTPGGQRETLIATVTPDNATNKTVTWSSSDANVATVDDKGNVTAVSAGTATITVTTEDGGYTATCEVDSDNIGPLKVCEVTLNKTTLTLISGQSETLVATVLPPEAGNKNVTWSSSNTGIVTVDQNGKVTAIAAGEANVTVTTEEGGYSASCLVTVEPKIIINPPELPFSYTIPVGETKQITIQYYNGQSDFTWSSSDISVATVISNGKASALVTGVGAGNATITATTVDGGYTCSCQVTVIPANVPVTGVKIVAPKVHELGAGESLTVTAQVLPDNATNKNVTWSTSDPSVLSIQGDGLECKVTVAATNPGTYTADVIVTTEDGGFTDQAPFSVKIGPMIKDSDLAAKIVYCPNEVPVGSKVPIIVSITNVGSAISSKAKVDFYLGACDTPCFSKQISGLKPNRSKTIIARILITGSPENPNTILSVVVVPDVADTNQDNNIDKSGITLLFPDLTITKAAAKASLTSGKTAVLAVDIANLNNVASGKFVIRVYDGDKVLGEKKVPSLTGTKSIKMGIKIPADFDPATETLRIVIDADNKVVESNEDNNILYYPSNS